MEIIQITTLILLAVFYIAYIAKALILRRRGITSNLLAKGDKPRTAIIIEWILRFATFVGAAIQFGSVFFSKFVWLFSLPLPAHIIGIFIMVVAIFFFILAMTTMEDNWRAGFADEQNTDLVTHGIYSISRNPAFVGFDLLYIGCALVFPNIINLLIALIAIILFHFQILGEENYCAEAFGSDYVSYKAKVRRYIVQRHLK